MDVMSIPSSVCSGVRDRKKETKKEKLVSLALATREREGGGQCEETRRKEEVLFSFFYDEFLPSKRGGSSSKDDVVGFMLVL